MHAGPAPGASTAATFRALSARGVTHVRVRAAHACVEDELRAGIADFPAEERGVLRAEERLTRARGRLLQVRAVLHAGRTSLSGVELSLSGERVLHAAFWAELLSAEEVLSPSKIDREIRRPRRDDDVRARLLAHEARGVLSRELARVTVRGSATSRCTRALTWKRGLTPSRERRARLASRGPFVSWRSARTEFTGRNRTSSRPLRARE